jgi:hypothetical protein
MLFFASATSVFLSFARFTEAARVILGSGPVQFEVSRSSVMAALVAVVLSGASALFYLPCLRNGDVAKGAAFLLLAPSFTIGSILSADPFSFAIFLGCVPAVLFVFSRLESVPALSPYLYILYFLPAVMVILFPAFVGSEVTLAELETLSAAAALLLALVFGCYLLFWPFGLILLRLLPSGNSAAPLVMSMVSAAGLFGFVKLLPQSSLLGQTVGVLAAVSTVAWTIACYRSREQASTVRTSYLAQTSAISVMIAWSMSGQSLHSGEWFLILSNHLVAGFGMMLCASLEEERRGLFAHVALIFFAYCFLGLPPSAGFFGRLHFFRGSFGDHGLFGYLLRLSFLASLFLVYCLPRSMASSSKGAESAVKTAWPAAWSAGLLAGVLLLSMFFMSYLRVYLSASGL